MGHSNPGTALAGRDMPAARDGIEGWGVRHYHQDALFLTIHLRQVLFYSARRSSSSPLWEPEFCAPSRAAEIYD